MVDAKSEATGVPEVSTTPLVLYNWLCPYVHRLTLALQHKKVADRVTYVDIDLNNKPPWILKFSPLSKVPAVTYLEGGETQVLIESLVLTQWVEDYFGGQGPSLLPDSAAARAKARIIISRFDSNVVSGWYKVLSGQDVAAGKEVLAAVHKELEWLESQLDPTGPFLLGAKPTLADAAIAPWLLRTFVIKHWRKVDFLEGHPKLQAWLSHYSQLPEVRATYKPPAGQTWEEAMIEGYSKYGKAVLDLS